MYDSDVSLKRVAFLTEAARRRAERALLKDDARAAAAARSLAKQIAAQRAAYRRQLTQLLGRSNMRRYRGLRDELSEFPRRRRIREAQRLLDSMGFDRVRGERLRQDYLRDIRRLLDTRSTVIPSRRVWPLDECSPWVTYVAPYHGYFWSFEWSRSDEADDPVINRYLDTTTGHIGSTISTRLSGADDDDDMYVDYYTSLNVWHTTQGTGVLEAYLAFEFNASPYSGKVTDEYGFSNATFQQWGGARFRVADTQGAFESQEHRVFNYIGTAWGDDETWSDQVFEPRDRHWYYFRTTVGFQQGSAVVLEAGIRNTTWFIADDQSIRTMDNLDLRLDRIMVRSCPGPVIL